MQRRSILLFLSKVAIFSALSFIFYIFFKFPLPFFPSFLEIQFSNLPAILSGYVLGPLGGGLVVIIRFFLKLMIIGTKTGGSGEFADLLIGLVTVMTSSLIYQKYKTRKGGLIGLLLGSLAWIITAIFTNIFIAIPWYKNALFGGSIEPLAGMLKSLYPNINSDNFMLYYIGLAVIPFNALLSTIVSLITFIVYKRVSTVFKFGIDETKKVLVASDSFKGSLSSKEVGQIVCDVLNNKGYKADYICVSDGGEGMLEALASVKKYLIKKEVKAVDALLREVQTYYLFDSQSNTAYIELANVVGIKDLTKDELNPYLASTKGVGILIKDAIVNAKAKTIILSIGGSASNDGGSGMLEALGVKFYHEDTQLVGLNNIGLKKVTRVDVTSLNALIKGITFKTLSDVKNPLLGSRGAVYTYGKQKGAQEHDFEVLESNMQNFFNVTKDVYPTLTDGEGYGAAGGVGFGSAVYLHAEILSGIDVLLKEVKFASLIKKYDIIITGEGAYDNQSANGKVVSGITSYNHKDIRIICGISEVTKDNVYAIVPNITSKEYSMAEPKKYLKLLIEKYF